MSTYCNHFEYIPFDYSECEKALKTLEEYLEGKKEKTVLNVVNCCDKQCLMCPECERLFEDQFVQRIKKNEVRTAARFLCYNRFGWIDFLEKQSLINFFIQVERAFYISRDEKRLPKLSFLFKKIFELRGEPKRVAKCGEPNLSRGTRAKYERIWTTICNWLEPRQVYPREEPFSFSTLKQKSAMRSSTQ